MWRENESNVLYMCFNMVLNTYLNINVDNGTLEQSNHCLIMSTGETAVMTPRCVYIRQSVPPTFDVDRRRVAARSPECM